MDFLDTAFLFSAELRLVLDHTADADPVRGWLPAYHFKICLLDGTMIGRCDLRIGHNRNLYYGGNIGSAFFPISAATTTPKRPAACCSGWQSGTIWAM